MRKNVPGSSRINMIKGLAYSPSAPCEWGINIWQRTCTASLAFQPPRLLCDRAANYGSIIIGVPDDGTIQFSRTVRSDILPCGECRWGKNFPSLTNPVESPSDNLNLKVFDKFRNSIDFLTNILLCGTECFRNFNCVISLVDIHRHKDEIIF